jgi:hypothetical protein
MNILFLINKKQIFMAKSRFKNIKRLKKQRKAEKLRIQEMNAVIRRHQKECRASLLEKIYIAFMIVVCLFALGCAVYCIYYTLAYIF